MAREVHAAYGQIPSKGLFAGRVALVLTYDENPEAPGLTKRWTDVGSAVLMMGFLFKGRVRSVWKVLSLEESEKYLRERAELERGAGI